MKRFLAFAMFYSAGRAELNGVGARGNFHSRAPMTYFLTWSFVKIIRWFAMYLFVFCGSRECAYSSAHTLSCEKIVFDAKTRLYSY